MATSVPNAAGNAAFILSLIAGLLILAGGGMTMALLPTGTAYGMMGGYSGMMNGYYGMMRGFVPGPGFYLLSAIAVIAGIVILVGAVMIYTRPSSTQTWGTIILAFSLLSLFGMGGFFLGAILGVVGGVLALTSQRN